MTKAAAMLDDRGVVRVDGEDATSFLQGLLTNDVARLHPGEACYAALLSPQGKILFDMLVARIPAESGAAYLLDCAALQAADLARRLSFYKLRARVAIADVSSDHRVIACWGGEPENAPAGVVYADPRNSRLGWRAILPRASAVALGEANVKEYEAQRIRAGVPKGGVDFPYGDVFPHDANLDLVNGVDFDKGCYVGQEVVSRMRHRGAARKRVARFTAAAAPPPPGTPVLDGELAVGTLGSSSGREALALVRLDRAEDARAAGRTLRAGGVGVTLAD